MSASPATGVRRRLLCLQVLYDPSALTQGQVLEVIEDAGFEAAVVQTHGDKPDRQVGSHPVQHLLGPHCTEDHQEIHPHFLQVAKLQVLGMHCSACSTAVEKALTGILGVGHATVSLTLQQAEIEYDATLTSVVRGPCTCAHSLASYHC